MHFAVIALVLIKEADKVAALCKFLLSRLVVDVLYVVNIIFTLCHFQVFEGPYKFSIRCFISLISKIKFKNHIHLFRHLFLPVDQLLT